MLNSTIAALATAPGQGGIAIIRISGPEAKMILRQVFFPKQKDFAWQSHQLVYGDLMENGQVLDSCMAVFMLAPKTYTREDVAEIHLHGGEYIVRRALHVLFQKGARPAAAGEFTKRAFLNGRIDLSSAEAVMQLIAATGERARQAAVRQLHGGAFEFVHHIQQTLLQMMAQVAAVIDFPDEVEEEAERETLLRQTDLCIGELLSACDERRARILDKGMEITLFGKPNAGKSSLFNALLMEERAIVTAVPGTTRDVLQGSVLLGGIRVNFSDTAGVREQTDEVETIGVARAMKSMEQADLTLVVLDGTTPLDREEAQLIRLTENKPRLLLQSKLDLAVCPKVDGVMMFSAVTGQGMEQVKNAILQAARVADDGGLTLMRHIHLAKEAAEHLQDAKMAFEGEAPVDLGAVHLQSALTTLGRITGEQVDEKLLDTVFSTFCVGK